MCKIELKNVACSVMAFHGLYVWLIHCVLVVFKCYLYTSALFSVTLHFFVNSPFCFNLLVLTNSISTHMVRILLRRTAQEVFCSAKYTTCLAIFVEELVIRHSEENAWHVWKFSSASTWRQPKINIIAKSFTLPLIAWLTHLLPQNLCMQRGSDIAQSTT